jgi:alpha-beta hydrolase superfamily lysophospholipase
MHHTEGLFKGYKNCQLYYQSWHPVEPSQAVVVLVHGLGRHSGAFQNVVEDLVPQGYAVYALDLRGHGHSAGQRGHINDWQEFREDLRAFLQTIRAQQAGCAYILWGHSLGGTIVLDYALRSPEQIQGLIVSAPALKKVSVPLWKLAIGQLLSTICPHFSLRLGIAHRLASRDPAAVAAYLQDPLRHEYGSARLATEFFATADWILQQIAELKIPLLLMHGSADQVTSPEGSRILFERVLFPDKEHREYPGNYHDLFIDVDHQKILQDVDLWLNRHLDGQSLCQSLIALPNNPPVSQLAQPG